MRVNRFVALATIVLMVLVGLGFMSVRSFAQPSQPAAKQAAGQAAATQAPTIAATQSGANSQLDQQGDQGGENGVPGAAEPAGSATEAPGAAEAVGATEVPGATEPAGAADTGGGQDQQSPSYTGSITVTQSATGNNLSESAEATALAGQAKITADQASAAALAANPGTTVVKTELGDENGTLIYSVELSNGSDVKVDAGNAKILATDTGGE